MIHTTLSLLKDKLNEYLDVKTGLGNNLIQFISGENDTLNFTSQCITPFLINIAEDRKFRNADQYIGEVKNGIRTQMNPRIRIELLILFVSKFDDYDQALQFLSYVIKFFQSNKVFTPLNSPELAEENIEKIVIDLISLPLEEQNQVWHSLNTSYLPSVLYKVRLLSFIDDDSIEFANAAIGDLKLTISKK